MFKFYNNLNDFKISNFVFKFSEISFHALNKENNYVIVQLQLNEEIGNLKKYDQIFIYHQDKLEGIHPNNN